MTLVRRIPKDLRKVLAAFGVSPSDLVLYVNSTCNLRCRHCYVGNDLLDSRVEYPASDILRLVNEFDHISRLTIVGGEPLLHSEINHIVESLPYERMDLVRLTTNLTTLARFDYQRLRRPLTLCVSLDGHNSRIHDEIRGAGAFGQTVENLGKVLAAGFVVEVTHTVTSHNIQHFDELLAFCRDVGVQRLNLHRISLQGNALDNKNLAVSPTEWVRFRRRLELMMKARVSDAGGIGVRFPVLFVTGEEFEDLVGSGKYHHHAKGSFYCDDDRMVLYPDGRIYISSEAFGTEAFVGDIASGELRWNEAPSNEITMFQEKMASIAKMNSLQSGDKNYPFVLSVSYKRSGLL